MKPDKIEHFYLIVSCKLLKYTFSFDSQPRFEQGGSRLVWKSFFTGFPGHLPEVIVPDLDPGFSTFQRRSTNVFHRIIAFSSSPNVGYPFGHRPNRKESWCHWYSCSILATKKWDIVMTFHILYENLRCIEFVDRLKLRSERQNLKP